MNFDPADGLLDPRYGLPRFEDLPKVDMGFTDAYAEIDGDDAEKIRSGRLEEFSVGFDNNLDHVESTVDAIGELQREYSMSFEVDFGEYVDRLVVEELLDGDEYHAIGVTPESKGGLLYYLRDMVHELRHAGYLSTGDDLGAIAASTQADGDDEPTAMQLIRDSFEQHERVETPTIDEPKLHVDGVAVYPADELPPGVVVAVAVDALADTPPGVTKPFVVRDRAGVEIRHLNFVGEA